MSSKNKSKANHVLKSLLMVPMVFGVLFFSSCETEEETTNNIESVTESKIVTETNKSSFETEEVSFSVVDQVPIYPGCDGSKDEKTCMSNSINKFVAKNFNTEIGKTLGLIGKQKILCFFTINKEGDVENIKTRAPHSELEEETRRVINMIPKLKAGEQDGKPVNVTLFLPIIFDVAE